MLDLTSLDDGYLTALAKALHEARFCHDSNDPTVWVSPFVIDLHVWALDERRQRDLEQGQDGDWEPWLRWRGRPEISTVIGRLREDRKLLDLVTQDPDRLRAILRPFVLDDESVAEMITAAQSTG
jgi:hypothetical protein